MVSRFCETRPTAVGAMGVLAVAQFLQQPFPAAAADSATGRRLVAEIAAPGPAPRRSLRTTVTPTGRRSGTRADPRVLTRCAHLRLGAVSG
jgi:hypothetical protein